ncbi:MAG: YjgP/YjgQ family permease [Bacteroidetes bacterium HGW-Bacteroidetes-10]|nr:MAG: YjgP/YjgQ family permease [Bacteroidetes bacterium HGW-Bacteroidetes-10]
MKKLDRFIVQAFLGPFILTFLIVTFVLMMHFLWLYIDELVGKGLSFGVILEFMGWGAATLIPLALPLATLLASIMTLGGFGENNELLAMKAAGISLPRVLTPLIVVSVLISTGAFFASNNLIPLAYDNIYTLRDDINRTKEEISIPTGIFYDGIENYTLRIDRRDEKTDILYKLMVYDHSRNLGNTSITVADSGSIKLTGDKQNLLFTLYDGNTYEETPRESMMDTSYTMQKVGFKKQEMVISLANYAFQRSESGRFSGEVNALKISELRIMRDSLDTTYAKVKEFQVRNLIMAAGLNYSRQFDSSVTNKYTAKVDIDQLLKWESPEEKQSTYEQAIAQMETANALLDNYEIEEQQYPLPLRQARSALYRKFTVSLACLIFFFIGAPLGAIIRKGGLGTPSVISILFFVFYWVIDISGKKLATDGSLSPGMGSLISSIILLPIGIFLTWKSTQDSNLFNPEKYLAFFRKLMGDKGDNNIQ